ncbi:MAG: thrombospondin type 3 repeat-containing protein [Bacteroidales bacterium]|nr:thrombospondin type 3 repeat-containing protein [Bacteroidales bacterium]
MKQYITLLLLALLVPAFSFGQDYKYQSREEDEYNKNYKYKHFEPLTEDQIKHYKNDFFDFKRIEDYTPYNDDLFMLPYLDFPISYQDSVLHTENNAWFENTPRFIGQIDKRFILRYEKKGQIEAFVYEEYAYGSPLPGLWVAYSTNSGSSWEYYYTGIVQKKPLFVKWYSNSPLINDNGDLQMEACLFIQDRTIGPWGMEHFKLAEDGLLLTFDLQTLRRDSDGDGLTDIVEAKFHTEPNNPDTDGDGIPDNLDLNPRFSLPRTDKTIVFEVVLNDDERLSFTWGGAYELIPLDEVTPPNYATDTTPTLMIVSDDPNLLAVQPTHERIIFLTSEEYESEPRYYSDDLDGYRITPLFKADYLDDTFVFSMSSTKGSSWESGYYATRTKEGWDIGVTFQMIE